MAQEDLFKKLVAHCKEYGYVFPSSEIYDGLAAVYDYGQYGVRGCRFAQLFGCAIAHLDADERGAGRAAVHYES